MRVNGHSHLTAAAPKKSAPAPVQAATQAATAAAPAAPAQTDLLSAINELIQLQKQALEASKPKEPTPEEKAAAEERQRQVDAWMKEETARFEQQAQQMNGMLGVSTTGLASFGSSLGGFDYQLPSFTLAPTPESLGFGAAAPVSFDAVGSGPIAVPSFMPQMRRFR